MNAKLPVIFRIRSGQRGAFSIMSGLHLPAAIPPTGKCRHNRPRTSTKSAITRLVTPSCRMENNEAHPGQQRHTIPRHGCRRWIIHLFLIFLAGSVPTAILGFTVGFLPFRALAVSPLSFPVMMMPCRNPTFITAVGLTPETTTADTEKNVTPLTLDLTQQQNKPAFGLAIRRKQAYHFIFCVGLPGLVVQKKGPKCQLRAFYLLFIVSPPIRILPKIRTKSKAKDILTKRAGLR
jgi:hypothetical protein